MSFKEYLKKKIKPVVGLSLLVSLVSTVVFPVGMLQASEPRFNYMEGDFEMLRGRNATANQSTWTDPVTGHAGDSFEVSLYYHNGVEMTDAINTVVKAAVPAETTDKTAIITASIGADNAATVYDTIVNDQIVGFTGLTIKLDQDAELTVDPNSIAWYPEYLAKGFDQKTALPGSQTGMEMFTADGLNLGTIKGCWEYAGFIRFTVNTVTKKVDVPSIVIQKKVKNVTKGENTYAKSTEAKKDETVEFLIDVKNDGNVALDSVKVNDILPSELAYVAGSFKELTQEKIIDLPDSSAAELFGSDLVLTEPLAIGATKTYIFRANAAAVTATKTVVNKAVATAGTLKAEDTATVVLKPADVVEIEKHKKAVNLTTNKNAELGEQGQYLVDASAGEEIKYTLLTKNNGNISTEYIIEDGIADILEYADVIEISDGGEVVDGSTGNEAKLIRYPKVTLSPGQTLERTFKVRIKNPLPNAPVNGVSFDDKLYNKYGDEIVVCIIRPVIEKKVVLKIEKVVRNVTANILEFADMNEAMAGDILEYKINFSNTGNIPADGVKFYDTIPVNTQYIAGTTVLSKNGGEERTLPDGIAEDGLTLDNIAPGDSGYFKFRILTSKSIAAEETLVNTAYLKYKDQILSDTAKTNIKEVPAPIPTPQPEGPKPVVPTLPVTGTAASVSFFSTLLMGIAAVYAKYRQEIADGLEVVKVASDIAKM